MCFEAHFTHFGTIQKNVRKMKSSRQVPCDIANYALPLNFHFVRTWERKIIQPIGSCDNESRADSPMNSVLSTKSLHGVTFDPNAFRPLDVLLPLSRHPKIICLYEFIYKSVPQYILSSIAVSIYPLAHLFTSPRHLIPSKSITHKTSHHSPPRMRFP